MKNRIIYYNDLLNDDFAGTNIKTIKIDKNYKYNKSKIMRFISFIFKNIIVKPIVFLFVKVVFLQKTKNKKALKDIKKSGSFFYYNHTSGLYDAFIPNYIPFFKDNYMIVSGDAVSIKGIKGVVKMLGGIPVGQDITSNKNMIKEMKYLIDKKKQITIYPEAHIWPYYNDIRPYLDKSFYYPVVLNTKVYAVTNCMVKRKLFVKLPKIVTYIDGPFYKDESLSKHEAMKKLRDECYYAMKKRADENSNYEYYKYIYKKDESDLK